MKKRVTSLNPNMAAIHRQRISTLCESLRDENGRVQAVELLRTLADQVAFVPDGKALAVVPRRDFAAILAFAANRKKPDLLSEIGLMGDLPSPVSVVAGTGFEPVTFRL